MAESRHLNNQHDWKVRNVTRLNRVISNWSGSVGMVSRMTMNAKVWAVLCCLGLSLLVVNPALASAEPEIPPTTPVPTEQQVIEAPAVVAPEQSVPQQAPAPEPAPVPVPQPAPEPALPAPAIVQPPAVVLPPAATVPPVTVAPAPQTQAPAPPPPAAETVAPEVTATVTQAPAPRVVTTEAPEPAPRETEVSTTSAAPSPTEKPAREGEVPATTTTTVVTATEETPEPTGSTASEAPRTTAEATVSSESAASEPQTTTASQVAEEDVKLADVEAPQGAVSEAELSVPLEVQAPAVPEPASEITEATVADLASLVREYERGGHNPPTSTSASSTTPTTTTTRGNGGGHGNGHNGPRPRPGDWCDNQRGPHGCSWNNWDWDHNGYPVVKNPFKFKIDFLWCDPRTGQWLKVSVNPFSTRTIEVEYRDRDFGFAVSAGPGGFSGNLAFGTFNHRPDNCYDRCRPSYQNLHRVDYRYWIDNRWQYNNAPVYNCGCAEDRVFWNNQWYDRVWWGGTQEVLGTWAPAPEPNHPPVFQPILQKQTPLSTEYVDAVVGGPVKGGDPSQVQNNAMPTVVTPILSEMWRNILIVVALAIAAVAVAIIHYRHVKRDRPSAS